MRLRTIFIIIFGVVALAFLYAQRAILTPFIIAAIFAFIFNPVVNFFTHRVKLPRTISVIIIYLVIISVFAALIVILARAFLLESAEFKASINAFMSGARGEISLLPPEVRASVYQTVGSIENADFFNVSSFFALFPKAIGGAIALIIFLVSSFYFLKEGKSVIEKSLLLVPRDYKVEVEILLRKINTVLGGYLRGQIFLIFLVSLVLFIALSILGIRFALIIAIFSGIAEIVPWIGPIVAATVAVVSVLLGGGSANFSLSPIQASIGVVVIYFVVRQIQDYFIVPHVMGRITKLHPLIVLFAVLAGEHTAGILGLLLAVPLAAVLKILLEFSVDTINDKEILDNKKPGR